MTLLLMCGSSHIKQQMKYKYDKYDNNIIEMKRKGKYNDKCEWKMVASLPSCHGSA